jgi:hypothetical protein
MLMVDISEKNLEETITASLITGGPVIRAGRPARLYPGPANG